MNYYPHHIGDYITATAHLTMLEDGAYRRLLDLYYSTEKALPLDRKALYRLARARTKEEQEAVDIVIEEFFSDTDDGWFHSRCDEEIEKARVLAERARANGKKGGRPPKSKPSDNPTPKPEVDDDNPAETQRVISGLAGHNPEQTQGEPSDNPTPKPPIPIPIPTTNIKESTSAAAPTPPPEWPEEDPPAALPGHGSDPVYVRALELVILLRQRGAALQADPYVQRWAATGVTDAQALQALETAQKRRENANSAAPIGSGYLDAILTDITAQPQASAAPGNDPYREKLRREQEVADEVWGRTPERRNEIDMGVIDATDN